MDAILTAKMNGNPGEADWARGGQSVLWIPALNHLLSPLPATPATHTSVNTIPPFNLSPYTYLPQMHSCSSHAFSSTILSYASSHASTSLAMLHYTPLGMCVHAQLCLTLCDPMNFNPPGSSVHGIRQAEIPEWIATFSSRGPSGPRD